MAKAGWVFVRAGPLWPDGGNGLLRSTIPLDINVLQAGPAPYDHSHVLLGGFGLPSNNAPAGYELYWHELIEQGAFRQMVTHGAPNHDHEAALAWHLAFAYCTDAYAAVLEASNDTHIAAVCPIVGGVIGDPDATPWTAGERTTWEARISTVLGLDLPAVVDRPARLVAWLMGALQARTSTNEAALRFAQVA
ncbi:hypothetical protein KKH23_05390 [Patescibacteria group bacterium]|nr:hypothetical protein [Patescibacteria group bacterium]